VKGEGDTIVAAATAPGRAGVAIAGTMPEPRCLARREFREPGGAALDDGMLVYFPGPRSFTGEDVVELHCHGGPVVVDLLLGTVVRNGARLAEAGEFSRRAFLNGRMDLAQAEAVADLIDAGSARAVRAAARSLQGEFSDRVHALAKSVTDLRVFVEAALDFPEEEIDFLSDAGLTDRLDHLMAGFANLTEVATQGALLRDGISVVLAGPPNAGKSSLLNRLTGQDTAIVTHLPGTTRDVLRERISVDGMPLHVIDTAGLRAAGNEAEAEGIRRAHREIGGADLVLLVIDASAPVSEEDVADIIGLLPGGVPVTIIRNKIDLTGEKPGRRPISEGTCPVLALSALDGRGIEELRRHLADLVGYQPAAEGALSARRRHLEALIKAQRHVEAGRRQLLGSGSAELLAEELRLASDRLGEITGEFTTEDLLGRIFSSFCVGK
jgi:tRNA modification GTPase